MDAFDIVRAEPIEKGWSGDKKYRAVGRGGEEYLLRVSPTEKLEQCRAAHELALAAFSAGLPTPQPFACIEREDGIYSLTGWVDGIPAEEYLSRIGEDAQYSLGAEAGAVLKKLHSFPAPDGLEDWETSFNRKIDKRLRQYRDCPLELDGADGFISYIEENRHLLRGRPQSPCHGDYHIGNMMMSADGRLQIIDFDRCGFGDPWEDFKRIVWCAQSSTSFASGMVDGYFCGCVPDVFWRLLALYISCNAIASLPWAIPFGHGEIDVMRRQAREVLGWYDGMKRPIPSWYQNRVKTPENAPLDAEEIGRLLPYGLRRTDVRVLDVTGSTNDLAKRLLAEGVAHGATVLAERQTAGRGRLGRSFYSPEGSGLYMSLILRSESFDLNDIQLVTVMAAVAVCRAISAQTGVEPSIKWVNDIFIGGKKVCGILAETSGFGDIGGVVIGIGVNCTTEAFPPELADVACSIGPGVSRNALAAGIIAELLTLSKDLRSRDIIEEYRRRSYTIGRRVAFERDGSSRTAVAVGISDDGSLIVREDDGGTCALRTGEARLI